MGAAGSPFWLEKGREEARPVLDRLIAEGVFLIEGSIAAEVTAASREALNAGPAPVESEQLNVRRYSLSAMVDDVTHAKDPGLRDVAMSTAWKEAAELALLSRRGWIGSDTWLFRELRAPGDPFNLAAWVDQGDRDAAASHVSAEARRALVTQMVLRTGTRWSSGFRSNLSTELIGPYQVI